MIFRCPVCHATVYEQLMPAEQSGSRLSARLYACAGCTIVFADPARVTRPGSGVPGQPVATPDFRRVHAPAKTPAVRRSRARAGKPAR